MFLQNASFFAKCKLHLARFAVDQTADAFGKARFSGKIPQAHGEDDFFRNRKA